MMDQTSNKEICAIVRLKSQKDVHKANLVDDFQLVKSMLKNKLSGELLDNWIKKKQQETYTHVSPEWQGCDWQYPGWVKE